MTVLKLFFTINWAFWQHCWVCTFLCRQLIGLGCCGDVTGYDALTNMLPWPPVTTVLYSVQGVFDSKPEKFNNIFLFCFTVYFIS